MSVMIPRLDRKVKSVSVHLCESWVGEGLVTSLYCIPINRPGDYQANVLNRRVKRVMGWGEMSFSPYVLAFNVYRRLSTLLLIMDETQV